MEIIGGPSGLPTDSEALALVALNAAAALPVVVS